MIHQTSIYAFIVVLAFATLETVHFNSAIANVVIDNQLNKS
jgi:hypothetical protein